MLTTHATTDNVILPGSCNIRISAQVHEDLLFKDGKACTLTLHQLQRRLSKMCSSVHFSFHGDFRLSVIVVKD